MGRKLTTVLLGGYRGNDDNGSGGGGVSLVDSAMLAAMPPRLPAKSGSNELVAGVQTDDDDDAAACADGSQAKQFRQIQLAKTDACPLSSSEREALSECPFPAHLLRQLFQWMPLRGVLRLGLTCKGLFTLYRGSLATDRRSLVLANGHWQFEHTNRSPFICEWTSKRANTHAQRRQRETGQ
ncbi:hypothetical protein TYRP_009683 [Tyrophagus putrescentiae]|nr:hypothetical protein TYRP_009683 [Tyrophagus putrescentiae]